MNQLIDDYSFDTAEKKAAARQFFSKVYLYMFFALIVSGGVAYQYGTVEFISKYFLKIGADGQAAIAPLFYVVMFSPIAIAMLFSSMMHRLSFPLLFGLFTIYSILIGFSLSSIFIVYSATSIALVFGVSAGTFATMAIMGYVTKADLTKMGSILSMAFMGIFIASIVNIFIGWEKLNFIISIIGVVVFTGLTAYHMQSLKNYALESQDSAEDKNKMALMGGFTLYVLFINLFMALLRIFGSRD